MESNPTIKKQVYTDRYSNTQSPHTGPSQTNADYNSFDTGNVGPEGLVNGGGGEEYQNLARGQQGEGMGDEEIWGDMSEEAYVNAYRNHVEPQQRSEAEALMAEMSSQAREGEEPAFDPKKQIADLKKELQKSENSIALDDDDKEILNNKIRETEKLIGKRGTDPEELRGKIEDLQDEINSALQEAKSTRQEKISTMKGAIDQLKKDIDKSHLPDAKKTDLKNRLDTLKSDLKKDSVDLKAATESLEGIQKEFRKEKTIKELKKKLETLPAKIPGEGWHHEEAAQLATKIAEAVRTDNWSEVNNFLNYYMSHDTNKPNNFIPQVIGTIFLDLAGSDEDKLDQLLAIIPENTRNLLARAAPGDNADSTEHLDNQAKYKYYGTPRSTASRLLSSRIEEASENLGEEELSSSSSSS
ncbi:MAG: hypothetical protein U1F66_06075 [bacterium]